MVSKNHFVPVDHIALAQLLISTTRYALARSDEVMIVEQVRGLLYDYSSYIPLPQLEVIIDDLRLRHKRYTPGPYHAEHCWEEIYDWLSDKENLDVYGKKYYAHPDQRDVKRSELFLLITYSLRNTLGSKSYMPGVICGLIHSFAPLFSRLNNKCLADDIEAYLRQSRPDEKPWDNTSWRKALTFLQSLNRAS